MDSRFEALGMRENSPTRATQIIRSEAGRDRRKTRDRRRNGTAVKPPSRPRGRVAHLCIKFRVSREIEIERGRGIDLDGSKTRVARRVALLLFDSPGAPEAEIPGVQQSLRFAR